MLIGKCVIIIVAAGDAIASFTSTYVNLFVSHTIHVCDGTHMNRMIFFDLTKMLCIYCIISLEGFGDSYSAREALRRQSLIINISIYFYRHYIICVLWPL